MSRRKTICRASITERGLLRCWRAERECRRCFRLRVSQEAGLFLTTNIGYQSHHRAPHRDKPAPRPCGEGRQAGRDPQAAIESWAQGPPVFRSRFTPPFFHPAAGALLISGPGVKGHHRQATGKVFIQRATPGLGDHELRSVHPLLNVVDPPRHAHRGQAPKPFAQTFLPALIAACDSDDRARALYLRDFCQNALRVPVSRAAQENQNLNSVRLDSQHVARNAPGRKGRKKRVDGLAGGHHLAAR